MRIPRNMGRWDRLARLVSGGVLLVVAAAGAFPPVTNAVLAAAGLLLVVTSAVGYCPLYSVVRFDTLGSRTGGRRPHAG